MPKMPDYTEAETLYGTARELVAAASVLFLQDATRFVSTINLLMGYASEMFMKSALAEAEVSANDRHGHNLLTLFQTAESLRLLEFTGKANFARMVEIMAPAHKQNSLRYMRPGSVISIIDSIGPAIFTLNELDAHVRAQVVRTP